MKPILFNTEMVRAILEGRKTVTRRVVKPANPFTTGEYRQGDGLWIDGYSKDDEPNGHIKDYSVSSCWITKSRYIELYAPYKVGDVLYVRETWYKGLSRVLYKADYTDRDKFYKHGEEFIIKWKPSIHMPKAAARIFLKVTDVRVERLRDITDLEAEGIKVEPILNDPEGTYYKRRIAFKELWDSTITKDQYKYYCWDVNPYVWVIEFERVEKPEAAV